MPKSKEPRRTSPASEEPRADGPSPWADEGWSPPPDSGESSPFSGGSPSLGFGSSETVAEPLLAPAADGSLDFAGALAMFGHESFRPGQREAVDSLLDAGRLLLVAPTGGGKSLTYQLPAILLPGTTLVISPLIALMHDQVRSLHQCGIPATFLASTLGGDEMRARMRSLAQGAYKLIYVAPERLSFAGFRGLLARIRVPLVAIDEAHCISAWGHDFRPEYMQIGEFIAGLTQSAPDTKVLACTATATPVVRDEILANLTLGPKTRQIVRGFARANLRLSAAEAGRTRDRQERIDALLEQALGRPAARPEPDGGSAIVYCPTRKLTEQEATRLSGEGWACAAYHAGLDGEVRRTVLAAFSAGALQVVVATNAFGMGIDRGDVRAVAHWAPPGSIEAYYQEVGRAGRDGEPAWGMMMYSAQDLPLRRRLLELDTAGRRPDPQIVEHKWQMFLELIRWAEGGSCRHDAILRYFGDEDELLQGCGHCDVCESMANGAGESSEFDEGETTLIVRKALSGVARIHGRYGLSAAANLIAGVDDPRLQRSGLDQVKTFGVLSEHDARWLKKVLQRCVAAGWVEYSSGERPLALLSEAGKAVMMAKRDARMVLPSTTLDSGRKSSRGGGRSGKISERVELELDASAQDLFEALRSHRLELARDLGVPPYVVASDRTLREIAVLKPSSLGELQQAHGIGPSKSEKYGEGLLAIVQSEG